ncbi:hypothetical protein [Sphingomicrobium clamense]|uniref:Uncharacterized protein n=1 Tax=Sphingomicrobium clamense TaxID=2851013 RepID=A0ABS6V3W3_9SPHN|nr:hypothetical protein [Sphingomicrobium sp. B8]MBW0144234.1 hypothetical protein [Sphingomicrobium sp. B8]
MELPQILMIVAGIIMLVASWGLFNRDSLGDVPRKALAALQALAGIVILVAALM